MGQYTVLLGAPCITYIYSYIRIEKGANGRAGMGGAADALQRVHAGLSNQA